MSEERTHISDSPKDATKFGQVRERESGGFTPESRALCFMGGSVLVTPTHIELAFLDDDANYDELNPKYRILHIPESEREQIAKFLLGGGEA